MRGCIIGQEARMPFKQRSVESLSGLLNNPQKYVWIMMQSWESLSIFTFQRCHISSKMAIFRGHVSFATSAIFARVQILAAAVFVLHCKQYLPWIANSIWLALQTICVSNCKQYFSCTANNISVTLQKYFSHIAKNICLAFKTIFVSHCKQYFCHIANNICLIFQAKFFSHCKQYFSHIANNICFALQTIFVSCFKHYLSPIARRVSPTLSQTSRKIVRNDLSQGIPIKNTLCLSLQCTLVGVCVWDPKELLPVPEFPPGFDQWMVWVVFISSRYLIRI